MQHNRTCSIVTQTDQNMSRKYVVKFLWVNECFTLSRCCFCCSKRAFSCLLRRSLHNNNETTGTHQLSNAPTMPNSTNAWDLLPLLQLTFRPWHISFSSLHSVVRSSIVLVTAWDQSVETIDHRYSKMSFLSVRVVALSVVVAAVVFVARLVVAVVVTVSIWWVLFQLLIVHRAASGGREQKWYVTWCDGRERVGRERRLQMPKKGNTKRMLYENEMSTRSNCITTQDMCNLWTKYSHTNAIETKPKCKITSCIEQSIYAETRHY